MREAPSYVPGHQLLAGKSVLITAAAGAGIGFAAARKCAEEGCRALMISDIHPRRLEEAVAKLKADTGLQHVWGQLCNVTNEEEVQALVAAAEDKLGGVDVLINNAGLGGEKRVTEMGVLSRNRRNFRHPSSRPATSASRSIILPSLWKV
ncbi:SDR family NAD(P)-dependent oxidoreductase [Thauera sp. WH-1]|uniref:SDR family NAD(P)-dependent oxidoreductase n=1 Tax=Thauera sp. WH-1 TaxID=3398230 RepID=UPI0039FDA0DE